MERISCSKSQKEEKKKTGNSEELSVSVFLTMVFSNKMKGLLIVLSVSVRLSVFVLR